MEVELRLPWETAGSVPGGGDFDTSRDERYGTIARKARMFDKPLIPKDYNVKFLLVFQAARISDMRCESDGACYRQATECHSSPGAPRLARLCFWSLYRNCRNVMRSSSAAFV